MIILYWVLILWDSFPIFLILYLFADGIYFLINKKWATRSISRFFLLCWMLAATVTGPIYSMKLNSRFQIRKTLGTFFSEHFILNKLYEKSFLYADFVVIIPLAMLLAFIMWNLWHSASSLIRKSFNS